MIHHTHSERESKVSSYTVSSLIGLCIPDFLPYSIQSRPIASCQAVWSQPYHLMQWNYKPIIGFLHQSSLSSQTKTWTWYYVKNQVDWVPDGRIFIIFTITPEVPDHFTGMLLVEYLPSMGSWNHWLKNDLLMTKG